MTVEVRRFSDPAALYQSAASIFVQTATEAVRGSGGCNVALAGGSTPRAMYALLADDVRLRMAMEWEAVAFFWGDERHVPPDHPDSNYRMAHDAMLSRLPIRPERVHRIKSELDDPAAAAAAYESDVRQSVPSVRGIPRFDLIVLGLGGDGHTASLFPGTAALSERDRLVVANRVDTLKTWRITMTLPLINAARAVMFVVAGGEKAAAVRSILGPDDVPPRLPARLVQPADGTVLWLLDSAAAKGLG